MLFFNSKSIQLSGTQLVVHRMHSFRKRHTDIQKYVLFIKRYISNETLSKVLVANRGEIACRLITCARNLGIKTVSVYNEADRNSLHTKISDESCCIGGLDSQSTYLSIEKLIQTAKNSGANAIHPGYGFLSQSPEFADACLKNNITWVGPSSHAIRTMGIKSFAKDIMIKANVPVIPGYHGENQDIENLEKKAIEIGFPVMVKPVRGGGGKGMRVVKDIKDFRSSVESAKRESIKSFGDDELLIEKYVEDPRHIEVQVIGDNYGNVVYLYERDCSVQRRHQKIIEEAPAPNLSDEIRRSLGTAAVNAAKAVGYSNAGTVEFVMDKKGNFYFMEMNTRLQVEHPVTEMITKVNLVELQYKVAKGEKLPFSQNDISIHGHSFEARIYAEDPDNNFIPCTGVIDKIFMPFQTENVRIDTGVTDGSEISSHFDPMIAKLITWGSDRNQALNKLNHSLDRFHVVGLATNISFLKNIAKNDSFCNADVTTSFIDDHHDSLMSQKIHHSYQEFAAGIIAMNYAQENTIFSAFNNFRLNSFFEESNKILCDEKPIFTNCVWYSENGKNMLKLKIDDGVILLEYSVDKDTIILRTLGENEQKYNFRFYYSQNNNEFVVIGNDKFISFKKEVPSYDLIENNSLMDGGNIQSPMDGTVVMLNVKPGDPVKAGDVLAVVEAMKMEHSICSASTGIVQEVNFSIKDAVKKGSTIITIDSNA